MYARPRPLTTETSGAARRRAALGVLVLCLSGCAGVRDFFETKVYTTPVWWEDKGYNIPCCKLLPLELLIHPGEFDIMTDEMETKT